MSERWLFDLDGCLVDSFAATNLRPLASELLGQLRAAGHGVEIWSAGGAEYAERVACRVGIDHFVERYWMKDRGANGKWALPADVGGDGGGGSDAGSARPIVCVDDQPEGVPDGVHRVVVFPYLGENAHDRAFARVIEALSWQARP